MNYIKKDINAEFKGMKLSKYLKEELDLSSRFTRRAAEDRRIYINGKTRKLNYRIKEKDSLTIDLKEEETQNIEPWEREIDVVYEDTSILVVNKEADMVVHPTKNSKHHTLSNAIINHYRHNNENTIVRLVSRLDMDTSGTVLLAKNQYVHSYFAKELEKNTIKREYIAVVEGKFPKDIKIIDFPIYRDPIEKYKRVINNLGQESKTEVFSVKYINGYSILKLGLITGRTHQIRVHLSHLGYPIVGDSLYGGNEKFIERQVLHARTIKFTHPMTRENMVLNANIPDDISLLFDKLNIKEYDI